MAWRYRDPLTGETEYVVSVEDVRAMGGDGVVRAFRDQVHERLYGPDRGE